MRLCLLAAREYITGDNRANRRFAVHVLSVSRYIPVAATLYSERPLLMVATPCSALSLSYSGRAVYTHSLSGPALVRVVYMYICCMCRGMLCHMPIDY